jgi:hypothetical protein
LNYSLTATSHNSSTLTVTLTETSYEPFKSPSGDLLLAIGGSGGTGKVTQNGLINDWLAASQGFFGGSSFKGDQHTIVNNVGDHLFSISEQLVFTGAGRIGGDATLDFCSVTTVSSVPEPGTLFSGIFATCCGLFALAKNLAKRRDP